MFSEIIFLDLKIDNKLQKRGLQFTKRHCQCVGNESANSFFGKCGRGISVLI